MSKNELRLTWGGALLACAILLAFWVQLALKPQQSHAPKEQAPKHQLISSGPLTARPVSSVKPASISSAAVAPSSKREPARVAVEARSAETRPDCGVSPAVWRDYLRSFELADPSSQSVFSAPGVALAVRKAVPIQVETARKSFNDTFGREIAPPAVYVHASIAELRSHSCVVQGAVAFYDGAIHVADLSGEPRRADHWRGALWQNIAHEYTHHALSSQGTAGPSWFAEGMAMRQASEPGERFSVPLPGISLDAMAEGPRVDWTDETVERFYGQSYRMVGFLEYLCGDRPPCTQRLVNELRSVGSSPDTFERLTRSLVTDASTSPQELWQLYLARHQ